MRVVGMEVEMFGRRGRRLGATCPGPTPWLPPLLSLTPPLPCVPHSFHHPCCISPPAPTPSPTPLCPVLLCHASPCLWFLLRAGSHNPHSLDQRVRALKQVVVGQADLALVVLAVGVIVLEVHGRALGQAGLMVGGGGTGVDGVGGTSG